MVSWGRYVALGDSLTVGEGDLDSGGGFIGWARRLAGMLTERTGTACELVNLATGGATVPVVLAEQLPLLHGRRADLISLTIGMNDIRIPEFSPGPFEDGFGRLLDVLTAAAPTVLTCTLPDIAGIAPLPPEFVEIGHQRIRLASDIIRAQAARRGAVCLDAWAMPGTNDPSLFGPDRFHPNASGHRLLATTFADLLLPA